MSSSLRIAWVLGGPLMFTAATFVLMRTGLYDGSLVGLLFVAVRRYLPGVGLVKGATFGVLLLALALLPFVLPFLGELQDAPVLGGGLFVVLFLAMGMAEAAVAAQLEQCLPAPRQLLSLLLGYGLLAGLAVWTVFSFVSESGSLLLRVLFPQLGDH